MLLPNRTQLLSNVLFIALMAVAMVTGPLLSPDSIAAVQNSDAGRGAKLTETINDNRKRIALVIGNSSYRSSPLKTPTNDARIMAFTLRRLGFEVEEKNNLNYLEMIAAIEAFGNKLQAGGVGFFYFAGYGLQVSGANYLIPVDAEIEDGNVVSYKSVDTALVLTQMNQARSAFNIMVLDACRDTPFARTFRATGDGLARMDAPSGTLIAYATSPDSIASDGSGGNSIYTEELIKTLGTPGLSVEESFEQVRNAVHYRTAYVQVPWESSSLMEDFYLFSPSQMTKMLPAVVNAELIVPLPSTPPTAVKAQPVESIPSAPPAVINTEPVAPLPSPPQAAVKAKPVALLPSSPLSAVQAKPVAPVRSAPPAAVNTELVAPLPSVPLTAVQAKPVALLPSSPQSTVQAKPIASLPSAPPAVVKAAPLVPAPDSRQSVVTVQTLPLPTPSTGMELVPVSGGCFQMGDVFGENKPGRVYGSDEYPLHEACVSDFAIGSHEVTQGLWRKVMGTNPSENSSCGDCPVENVSWDDVQGFLRRLNSQTGRTYRLPTEAEWEYACRSGGKKERYCGGGNEDAVAWHAGNSGRKTHPVGQKKPNGLGIYDMSGNVWEWCHDWFGEYPAGSVSDYTGPASGSRRVFRGGSWSFDASYTRAAIRSSLSPDLRGNFLGFRLVSPGKVAKPANN